MSTQIVTVELDQYREHIRNNPQFCANCFGLRHLTDPFERLRTQTQLGYVPDVPPSESKRWFCNCGFESPDHRLWESEEVDRDRFVEMAKRLLRGLETVGHVVDRQEFIRICLVCYDDNYSIDECFSEAFAFAAASR